MQALAADMEDVQLQDLFPSRSPKDIRTILLQVAESLVPAVVDQRKSPPVQAELPLSSGKILKGQFSLYTDGAARGNPGEAGAGIVIFDNSGQEIIADCLYLGKCTNNMAEYRALLFGLEKARTLGVGDIAIYLDSELIVRQLQGVYKVKNEALKPLYNTAKKLITTFQATSINHVPRDQNKRADQLANRAIDKRV